MNWIFPLSGNPPVTESHAQGDPGVDWGVPVGTPVHAIAAGVVTKIGESGYGPAYVEVDHGGGVQSFYGHNNDALVKVGDHVTQGQVIADSGNLGNSTGPHLELGIRVNGQLVDPISFLTSGGAGHVPGDPSGAQPAGLVSDVGGAITGGIGSLLKGFLVIAVKGVLVLGGGAMVVLGVSATARRSPAGQAVTRQAAQVAALAA